MLIPVLPQPILLTFECIYKSDKILFFSRLKKGVRLIGSMGSESENRVQLIFCSFMMMFLNQTMSWCPLTEFTPEFFRYN